MHPDWVQEALDKGMVVPDGDTLLMREIGRWPPIRTTYIRAFPSRTRWAMRTHGAEIISPTNCRTPEQCRENGYATDEYTWVSNPLEVM